MPGYEIMGDDVTQKKIDWCVVVHYQTSLYRSEYMLLLCSARVISDGSFFYFTFHHLL
jgi:hypothetical protein